MANEKLLTPVLDLVVDVKTGRFSPDRIASSLQLTRCQLAKLLRVHRNTLNAAGSAKLSAHVCQLVWVLSSAAEVTGDVNKAIHWFKSQPLHPFGGLTPMKMVESDRALDVVEYIEHLSHGFLG